MFDKICRVVDCDITVRTRGLCNRHYLQISRYGELQQSTRDPRPAIIDGDVAKIPLGIDAKYGYAIVDKEYAWLDKYKWVINDSGYALTTFRQPYKRERMHRMIMSAKQGVEVDHINSNRLDNRQSNLRLCSRNQNNMNTGIRKHNTSGYKGVSLHKATGKWAAGIVHNYKKIHLGLFSDKKEAARAYNVAASKLHPEFARLNEL